MSGEFDSALRCRNYAEELRLIAADRTTTENRDTLLKVAEDYDRIARSYESIDRSKRVQGLPR